MKRKQLLQKLLPPEFIINKWGYLMNLMFDICAIMYNRELYIPEHWEYRPGILGAEVEGEYFDESPEDLNDFQLLEIGEYLYRLTRVLDKAGESY